MPEAPSVERRTGVAPNSQVTVVKAIPYVHGMASRDSKVRAAYQFLQSRSGSTVTPLELATAAGWAESTAKTYVSKMLKQWLAARWLCSV